MLEVRLLGTFEVKDKKKLIKISSRPAQSLFAYLILSAGISHRREKLAGMLWSDSLEETARDNLRHALWRLRKALPSQSKIEYVLADDLSIAFNASSEYWLDEAALDKVGENATTDELIAVLSTYQGELLPGFYDEWVLLEREHINSVFEHKMARLMSLLQEEKRWLDILDWGERWIKLGQKPESAYRALMSAHAAKGDMSKVAATYERCVKSLKEFGVAPSEQTKELYENLKSGKETPKNISVAKPIAKEAPSNIPVPLTSFIGRQKELKEIAKLLSSSRLFTLTGSGGVGKTRLAIQTANESTRKFKDGVFWVGLVGLSDANLIPQEIAQSLNVREITQEPLMETLKTYLKSKELLIVLDNCEHLIKTCAQVVEQLLAACLKLKILATSIEVLGLFNETTWQVPSLPLPEVQRLLSLKELQEFASIELFDERARSAKAGFALDEGTAAFVAQICRRLDGIPLAIELAAARVKVLSVGEIAARLDNRFSLLTAGSRTAMPRHQTLRATIDWSYDLLTESERILFRRLSVFAGGFTLEAAEAVCGFGELKRNEILDLLGRLVDKSLVVVESSSTLNETRYRLLETIRAFALIKTEEVGETVELQIRHLEFFAVFVTQAEKGIFSTEQAVWFERVEKEADNLRAAMDRPLSTLRKEDSKHHSIQKNQFLIVGSLTMFWERGYRREIIEVLKKMLVLDDPNEPTVERAKALATGGFLLWSLNDPLNARAHLEESAKIAEELGDDLTLAWSLCYLGWTFNSLGEYDKAQIFLERSLGIADALGEDGKYVAGHVVTFLGDIPYWRGDILEARKLYEAGIVFTRELNNKNMLTSPLRRLAYIEVREENFIQAAHLLVESLNLNRELGHLQGMVACLAGFAALNLAKENLEKAATLCGSVENLLQQYGGPFFFADTVEYERSVDNLKKALDEKVLAVTWSKGRAMTLEQAIDFALKVSKR